MNCGGDVVDFGRLAQATLQLPLRLALGRPLVGFVLCTAQRVGSRAGAFSFRFAFSEPSAAA